MDGFPGELLKREWKILRDSLRQSMKKCRKGATTKAGAPCRKWRFHARMAFVLPYMTRRCGSIYYIFTITSEQATSAP